MIQAGIHDFQEEAPAGPHPVVFPETAAYRVKDETSRRPGRVVQTASYDQMTRPIYNSSVGRYKPFEKHLGPLIEALAQR